MERRYPQEMLDSQLAAEIARMVAEQKWGQEHPYAGVCGEDDARADYLRELQEEQASRPQVGDNVIAVARPEIAGRKPYAGRLERLTDLTFSVHGAPFEGRDFSRKLWKIVRQ